MLQIRPQAVKTFFLNDSFHKLTCKPDGLDGGFFSSFCSIFSIHYVFFCSSYDFTSIILFSFYFLLSLFIVHLTYITFHSLKPIQTLLFDPAEYLWGKNKTVFNNSKQKYLSCHKTFFLYILIAYQASFHDIAATRQHLVRILRNMHKLVFIISPLKLDTYSGVQNSVIMKIQIM